MPIYEFRCEACGARFEALVEAGTDAVECRQCGAAGARRAYSQLAAPFRLVKTRGEARRQEGRNAQLRAAAKARFKQARASARARRRSPGGDGGDGGR